MVTNAVARLYFFAVSAIRLRLTTGFMFAAQSPLGRSVKILLFVVGIVLPLGSLIWVLLLWHGNAVVRSGYSGRDVAQAVAVKA